MCKAGSTSGIVLEEQLIIVNRDAIYILVTKGLDLGFKLWKQKFRIIVALIIFTQYVLNRNSITFCQVFFILL